MQKWEYLEVAALDRGNSFWVPYRVNGEELKDWRKGPNIHTYLNELGQQGWELVTIGTHDDYHFRRPIA